MLQDTSASSAAAPAATYNAEAMKAMGFDHLVQNFDPLGWIVFVVLVVMSVSSW